MFNRVLAYFICFGIIGAGVGWIVGGVHSAAWIGFGAAAVAAGVVSVLPERG